MIITSYKHHLIHLQHNIYHLIHTHQILHTLHYILLTIITTYRLIIVQTFQETSVLPSSCPLRKGL